MSQQGTINLLLWIQASIGLLISVRAFYLYTKNRSDDLAIIGIAMLTIALASLSGLAADNLFASTEHFGGKFNVLWFEYGGQTISYLFILFSTLQGSESYLSRLKRWQLIITGILILVLLATPIIPPFHDPTAQAILSNTRSLVCIIIFLRYSYFLFMKSSRFSYLMVFAFILLAFGIMIITVQFYPHGPIFAIYMGYAMRIGGLILLFLAFWLG